MKAKVYFLLAAVLAAALPGRLRAESLTITTTYPPPSAIYNQVTTTGEPNTDTTLNRNGGNTILVPPSNPNGNVGVGTKTPAKKLDVNGDIGSSGNITAVGDVKVGADSVFTGFSCSGGITCTRAGNNTLRIDLAANPVSCVGAWSGCSNGNMTYTITTPASGGGAACPYQSGQVQPCAQAVNCVGSWGACSATCGGGSQTYTITNPASGGGAACSYQSGQVQSCNTQACACVTNMATCTAPQPACGQVTYGTTNCGAGCQKTGNPCPPAQGSCHSTCTSRYFMSGVGACGGSIQVPCTGRGTVGQSVQCYAPASFCGGIDIYQACYTYCTAR